MPKKLTLRETMYVGNKPPIPSNITVIYEVVGLPPGHEVVIRQINHHWKLMRVKNGVRTSWSEGYASAEDALAVVQADFELGAS